MTLDQKASRYIQRNLEVAETMGGSSVLLLAFSGYTPQSAQAILSEFVDSYLEHHIEIHKNRVETSILERKADDITWKLIAKERELDHLKQDLNITSLAEEQTQSLQAKAELSATLNEIGYGIKTLESRIKYMTDSLENPKDSDEALLVEAAPESSELIVARDRLSQLELELINLRIDWTESSEPVQKMKKQIAEVESLIANYEADTGTILSPRGTNPVQESLFSDLQNSKVNLVSEQARREAIESAVASTEKDLTKLNLHAAKFKRLQRDIADLEGELNEFQSGIRASMMGDLLDEEKISNLEILQPATLPLRSASSPRKMFAICAFILFMGAAMGIGAAFGLDYLNHSLRTNDEVEQWLGLPVLVSLPKTREHRPQLREELP